MSGRILNWLFVVTGTPRNNEERERMLADNQCCVYYLRKYGVNLGICHNRFRDTRRSRLWHWMVTGHWPLKEGDRY